MPPSAENKTEKPTPRRRERAREEGEVAQSAEVNNVLVLLAAVGALALFGGRTFRILSEQVSGRLGGLHVPDLTMSGVIQLTHETVSVIGRAVMPVMICSLVVGVLCSVAQTGFLWAPKRVKPNLRAIDPVRGFKNMFSLNSLQKLAVAIAKLAIMGTIAFTLVRNRLDWLLTLSGKSTWGIMFVARTLCMSRVIRILLAMLVVAILDYAYERWRFEKKLMMSKGELKEEMKREDGDPEVRARRSHLRRSLVRRMIAAVPEADVVVTNPTEIAVALKWDEKTMGAPRVVAKGRNYMAERIKQVARENGVPVIERRAVARALYEAVEVGREIPAKLYYAVAEVLAFVLRGKRAPSNRR